MEMRGSDPDNSKSASRVDSEQPPSDVRSSPAEFLQVFDGALTQRFLEFDYKGIALSRGPRRRAGRARRRGSVAWMLWSNSVATREDPARLGRRGGPHRRCRGKAYDPAGLGDVLSSWARYSKDSFLREAGRRRFWLSSQFFDEVLDLLALGQLGVELRSAAERGDGVVLSTELGVRHAQVIPDGAVVGRLLSGARQRLLGVRIRAPPV